MKWTRVHHLIDGELNKVFWLWLDWLKKKRISHDPFFDGMSVLPWFSSPKDSNDWKKDEEEEEEEDCLGGFGLLGFGFTPYQHAVVMAETCLALINIKIRLYQDNMFNHSFPHPPYLFSTGGVTATQSQDDNHWKRSSFSEKSRL